MHDQVSHRILFVGLALKKFVVRFTLNLYTENSEDFRMRNTSAMAKQGQMG